MEETVSQAASEPRSTDVRGLPRPYYEHAGITIFNADCREILPTIPDASVDFIFTDPPYGHNNNNNGDLIHRWSSDCKRWS